MKASMFGKPLLVSVIAGALSTVLLDGSSFFPKHNGSLSIAASVMIACATALSWIIVPIVIGLQAPRWYFLQAFLPGLAMFAFFNTAGIADNIYLHLPAFSHHDLKVDYGYVSRWLSRVVLLSGPVCFIRYIHQRKREAQPHFAPAEEALGIDGKDNVWPPAPRKK